MARYNHANGLWSYSAATISSSVALGLRARGLRAVYIIHACFYADTGEKVFSDEDYAGINAAPAGYFAPLFNAAVELNGVNEGFDDIKKD